jgi:hypothetical protein
VRACDLIAPVSIRTGVTTRSRAQNFASGSAVRHRPRHRRRHSDPEEPPKTRIVLCCRPPPRCVRAGIWRHSCSFPVRRKTTTRPETMNRDRLRWKNAAQRRHGRKRKQEPEDRHLILRLRVLFRVVALPELNQCLPIGCSARSG